MKIKYKKILAQILSVAVVGSTFAVPVVCMSKPFIATNAADVTFVGKGSEGSFYCSYLADGSIAIEGCTESTSTLNVPKSVNGHAIKYITCFEFYNDWTGVNNINVSNSVSFLDTSRNIIDKSDAASIFSTYGITLSIDGVAVTTAETTTTTVAPIETTTVTSYATATATYTTTLSQETTATVTTTTITTPPETEQNVVDIGFENGINEAEHTEYAVITAYNEFGDTVWTYRTDEYSIGQLARVEELGEHNNAYYLVEGGTIVALDLETGEVLWQNDDFSGSGIAFAFGEDAIYIAGYFGPDFYAISYEGETLKQISKLDDDYNDSEYYWIDNIEIIDNRYAAIHFEANDGTLYVDLQTYEVLESLETSTTTSTEITTETATTTVTTTETATATTTETTTVTTTETTTETSITTTTKEPSVTYEWYVEPSIEADDINSVGVFMESIPHGSYDDNDYEYTYGQFIDTGYAVIKKGDFYGVIDMNGNIVIEPDYVLIRGAINEHFRLYDEEGGFAYFCCETGEYLDPREPHCAWCDKTLLSDVCSSYYCYDPEKDLLAYIGTMPGNDSEEVISLDSQNGSGKTIDFPEGKVIPVRLVSIDGDDVTLSDEYTIMKDGEFVTGFVYDNVLSYKNGVTAVEVDEEWYYFDEEGNQIIEDPCDVSYSFSNVDVPYLPSEDYIAFNTLWGGGYYDTDGEVVIPVGDFAEVRPVFNGLAWVKDHETGLWGVIQLTGEKADTPDNDNEDSDSDSDDGNGGSSSGNNSSSSGSTGKAAPKTGDDSGKVFALLALSAGVMVASRKRRDK